MQKTVLFVSTGTYAFGESVMALNFARSLPAARYRPCFAVSPQNALLLQEYPQFPAVQLYEGAHSINQIVLHDFLVRFPPELVILWDFLTFEFSQEEFGITLDFLRSFQAPIISLDSYEWESAGFALDFLGGFAKDVPPTLLDLDGALRPCPLNKPAAPRDRTVCYSFLHQLEPAPQDAARLVRKELDVPADAPIVFSASATWQAFRPKEKQGGPFAELLPQLIDAHILGLETDLHWIRVGPDKERGRVRRGRITEHTFPQLSASEFDRLLAASDVFVTTNVASTTLAKCVRYNGAALLLYNSVEAENPAELVDRQDVHVTAPLLELLEDAYPVQPFLMFPLGWYRFLAPVLKNNPYLDTFYPAEVLDGEQVKSLLGQALSKRQPGPDAERDNYQHQLAALPSPEQCLQHFSV